MYENSENSTNETETKMKNRNLLSTNDESSVSELSVIDSDDL